MTYLDTGCFVKLYYPEADSAQVIAKKSVNRQKLNIANKTRSNPALRDWRGQFTPEFVAPDLREAVKRIISVQSL